MEGKTTRHVPTSLVSSSVAPLVPRFTLERRLCLFFASFRREIIVMTPRLYILYMSKCLSKYACQLACQFRDDFFAPENSGGCRTLEALLNKSTAEMKDLIIWTRQILLQVTWFS